MDSPFIDRRLPNTVTFAAALDYCSSPPSTTPTGRTRIGLEFGEVLSAGFHRVDDQLVAIVVDRSDELE